MPFEELDQSDKLAIHEVLFQIDILELDDYDKVSVYYDKLPENIKKDGLRWGFSDSVVQDNMYEFFEKTLNENKNQ